MFVVVAMVTRLCLSNCWISRRCRCYYCCYYIVVLRRT